MLVSLSIYLYVYTYVCIHVYIHRDTLYQIVVDTFIDRHTFVHIQVQVIITDIICGRVYIRIWKGLVNVVPLTWGSIYWRKHNMVVALNTSHCSYRDCARTPQTQLLRNI